MAIPRSHRLANDANRGSAGEPSDGETPMYARPAHRPRNPRRREIAARRLDRAGVDGQESVHVSGLAGGALQSDLRRRERAGRETGAHRDCEAVGRRLEDAEARALAAALALSRHPAAAEREPVPDADGARVQQGAVVLRSSVCRGCPSMNEISSAPSALRSARTWSAVFKNHVEHDRPWTTHFTGTRSSSSSAGVRAVASGARWAAVRRLELPLLRLVLFALLRTRARQQDLEPLCIRLRERAVGPEFEGVLDAIGNSRRASRRGCTGRSPRASARRAPPAPRRPWSGAARTSRSAGRAGRNPTAGAHGASSVDGLVPGGRRRRTDVDGPRRTLLVPCPDRRRCAFFSESGRGRRGWLLASTFVDDPPRSSGKLAPIHQLLI